MKYIYKLYQFLYRKIAECIIYFFIRIKSLTKRKKIYLLGTPIHGNIGDQAILVAEKKFFKEMLGEYKLIIIPSFMIEALSSKLKKIITSEDKICIHGGGFLGNLWINEERMFRKCLELFSENKIVVLPQTVFFTSDEEGKNELINSKKIYKKHKKLIFFVREKYSYQYMKNNFKECEVYLVPDIVLYLKRINETKKNDKIILCLRNDKEKTISSTNEIKNMLDKFKKFNIKKTDMIVKIEIFSGLLRNLVVNNKIRQFSKAKLVITDRLHGMIFSYLANTPCIVLNSQSYKVKGVYDWLKSDSQIIFTEDTKIEKETIIEMIKSKNTGQNIKYDKEFKTIKEKIEVN